MQEKSEVQLNNSLHILSPTLYYVSSTLFHELQGDRGHTGVK